MIEFSFESWRRGASWLLCALLLACATHPASAATADAGDAPADFAERIAELGQNWLRTGALTVPAFRQTAALLGAAMRVDPREPRYPRLLATAMEQLHDTDGEIAAWSSYRKLVPDDRRAQVKVIELFASKMQTADAQIAYFKNLLSKPALPDEVRAHIAALCVKLLLDRSHDEAVAMAEQGLKLYPLPQLVQEHYFLVYKDAGPVDRIHGLLSLVKSNPVQPQVLEALARELALDGLTNDAVEWYSAALEVNNRLGLATAPQVMTDFIAELFLSGQNQSAQRLVSRMLDFAPDNASFLCLALSLQRSANDQVALIQNLAIAREILTRRWARLCETILANGKPPAPAADPTPPTTAPDVRQVVEKLKTLDKPQLTEAFALSAQDLAWLELYYANKPDAAVPWIDALREVVPPESPALARLEGWRLMEAGQTAQAHQQLFNVAERDPLAALALIRLDTADKSHTRDKLRLLLAKNPTGLAAAEINETLLGTEPPATAPAPQPAAATAPAPTTIPSLDPALASSIRAELTRFAKASLLLVDQPLRFYTVKAEPLSSTVRFGQAMFGRITLTNRADYDLVIGFGGPIQDPLWVDAKVTGITQQDFPSVAIDRISNVMVLRAHASTSQIMRIDQGALGEAIRQRANGSMVINASITTNPTKFGDFVGPGAAGESAPFSRTFIRLPTDLQSPSAQRQIQDSLATGSPSEKMQDLDLLGAYVQGLDKETNPSLRDAAEAYLQDILKTRVDRTPEVAAWAGYLSATLPGAPGRLQVIQEMASHPAWQSRLLALAALRRQPVDVQQRLSEPLSKSEADPLVKELAIATMESARVPTTNPATEHPTTQP